MNQSNSIRFYFIVTIVFLVTGQLAFSEVVFKDNFDGYSKRWEPTTTGRYYPNVGSYDRPDLDTWEPSCLPVEERNNSNSWNGWLRNSMGDKISIELNTGRNGTPSLQIAPQPGTAVHEKIGLIKWLKSGPNKGGYDELYVSWYFKFSNGYRFGVGKGVGYEKWLRLWTKVNLENMEGHGFGDERHWGHPILLNFTADYEFPQIPFWGISSYERTDSNTQEYIKLKGEYKKTKPDEFRFDGDTDYSIASGRSIKIIKNDTLLETMVLRADNAESPDASSGTISTVFKVDTQMLPSGIEESPDSVSPVDDSDSVSVYVKSSGVYQLCGPNSAAGNWYPGYFKTLNPGQLPFYIGPIDSDGYLINNGQNGKPSQEWHFLEVHVKLRDSSLSEECLSCIKLDCSDVCGGSNNTGAFEMWVDGIKLDNPIKYADGYKNPCLVLSTNEDGGITAISLHDNGTVSSGWTEQQYLWIDDFTISTTKVGPADDDGKPARPLLEIGSQ